MRSPFSSMLAVLGICSVLLLGGAAVHAQVVPTVLPAPHDALLALDVGDGTLQDLLLPATVDHPFTVQVHLDGGLRTLALVPHSVRADGFRLLVQGSDGILRETQPAPTNTFQGHVVGYPESVVAASLNQGQLTATIVLASGTPMWGIQPLSSVDPTARPSDHVVYNALDRLPGEELCGTPSLPAEVISATPPTSAAATDADKVAEIACDADVEFYNKNGGSVANTQADIENVINAMEAIYQADVGILYTVTTIIVRTSEPDPYSSTNSSTLLNQFRSEWNANQGAVQRDVAHLFTGKNIQGSIIGIAWLNVICNKSSGYGLSQSKFTSNFSFRTALTAHEVGHNWNAPHCDGDADCKIMCSGLGGCGAVTSFGTTAITKITNKKNSVTCLSNPGPPPIPTISNLSPNSVQTFQTPTVTVIGTGLSSITQVDVGAQTLGVGEFNNLGDTTLSFTPPAPPSLGSFSVTVTNASGTSNAATLTYTDTHPPELDSPFQTLTGQVHTWSYGGGANDFAFLVVSLGSTTSDFNGWPLLDNLILLQGRALDAAGLDSLSVTIPVSASGIQFWSQVATFNGGIVGTSNVAWSWIVF